MNKEELKPVDSVYKGGFFKNRHKLKWRVPIVVNALKNTYLLQCKTSYVVDVGCAIGDFVAGFKKRNIFAFGIEGSKAAKQFFESQDIVIWDLRKTLNNFNMKFTVAYSLEVAEHIEEQYAQTYVENLCILSDQVLISAATPGQKGHGHVNCQYPDYWVKLFNECGFEHDYFHEDRWKKQLEPYNNKKELSSYYKNALCFRRSTS